MNLFFTSSLLLAVLSAKPGMAAIRGQNVLDRNGAQEQRRLMGGLSMVGASALAKLDQKKYDELFEKLEEKCAELKTEITNLGTELTVTGGLETQLNTAVSATGAAEGAVAAIDHEAEGVAPILANMYKNACATLVERAEDQKKAQENVDKNEDETEEKQDELTDLIDLMTQVQAAATTNGLTMETPKDCTA